MPKSYEEISAARRTRLDPSVAAAREVFEKAYDIAMQIVALREKAGLTQVELAERCGISQADISRIERGGTSPTTQDPSAHRRGTRCRSPASGQDGRVSRFLVPDLTEINDEIEVVPPTMVS